MMKSTGFVLLASSIASATSIPHGRTSSISNQIQKPSGPGYITAPFIAVNGTDSRLSKRQLPTSVYGADYGTTYLNQSFSLLIQALPKHGSTQHAQPQVPLVKSKNAKAILSTIHPNRLRIVLAILTFPSRMAKAPRTEYMLWTLSPLEVCVSTVKPVQTNSP
jgi:hypothetical protein